MDIFKKFTVILVHLIPHFFIQFYYCAVFVFMIDCSLFEILLLPVIGLGWVYADHRISGKLTDMFGLYGSRLIHFADLFVMLLPLIPVFYSLVGNFTQSAKFWVAVLCLIVLDASVIYERLKLTRP